MTTTQTLDAPYAPRAMTSLGIWDIGDWRFKTTLIRADTAKPLSETMLASARLTVLGARDRMAATEHFNTGFIVLHEGRMAIWLLAHWWIKGGICCELLFKAPVAQPASFAAVTEPYMACVWELVPIDFERRAWVDTVLKNNGGLLGYLKTSLPDGNY